MNFIRGFIDKLSRETTSSNSYNLYNKDSDLNSIRRNNLELYLNHMLIVKPKFILVGEAPGYQGCRLTGIPFTSEYLILNGVNKLNIFGKNNGYSKTKEFEHVRTEPTATMVWEILSELNKLPLLWNAFPFHPFQGNNHFSNRSPTEGELKQGEIFLEDLINFFNIQEIVAVGNTAEYTLKNLGYHPLKVRHPARGGKMKFKEQLNKILY